MFIRFEPDVPMHAQIYEHVRDGVLCGRLAAGQRLLSSRALARELGVSRTVVLQAFDRLLAEGFLETRVGSGTFVRSDLPGRTDAPAPFRLRGPEVRLSAWARRFQTGVGRREVTPSPRSPSAGPSIDFAYGMPEPAAFPRAVWRRCLSQAAASGPSGYAHAGGSWVLRRAIRGYLARSRGVLAPVEQILVTSGSQQALDLVARLLLDPGDAVVIEEPQYQGARQIFQAAGARLHPVPVDEEGLDVAALPKGSGARLVSVTPSHQFPTGGVLPLSRRLRLLEWARDERALVFEDDYDGEYRYDVPPVEAIYALDQEGLVLHAGTFSKVLFPGLRLGYLVLPPGLVTPALMAKWLSDRHSAELEQRALARFIEEGHFERHIRRTRTLYGKRRRILLEALEAELGSRAVVSGADAGLHVTVWLPELSPDDLPSLQADALELGVGLYPATPYFLCPPQKAGLVFGYSTTPEERIATGVRVLRTLLDRR